MTFKQKYGSLSFLAISFLFHLSLQCETPLAPFDWGTILSVPWGKANPIGNQILHFNASNKPYWDNSSSRAFVEKTFMSSVPLESDAAVLRYASDSVCIDGVFIELGVCTGKTINFMAALNPSKKIYGFDSFEGLPEDWVRGDQVMPQGTFGYKSNLMIPPVLHNVILFKGWFDQTLPKFAQNELKDQPIALLHIDSDLYSCAAKALTVFERNIVDGTIILFDEFYNYTDFENHEYKAFHEFLKKTGWRGQYLAYNIYHEQVVVKICIDDLGKKNI